MCYFKQQKDRDDMADKATSLQKLALPSKTATKRTDMWLCPKDVTVHHGNWNTQMAFRNKCKVII